MDLIERDGIKFILLDDGVVVPFGEKDRFTIYPNGKKIWYMDEERIEIVNEKSKKGL